MVSETIEKIRTIVRLHREEEFIRRYEENFRPSIR